MFVKKDNSRIVSCIKLEGTTLTNFIETKDKPVIVMGNTSSIQVNKEVLFLSNPNWLFRIEWDLFFWKQQYDRGNSFIEECNNLII